MKALHRPDLFGWSTFDEGKNIDFNGTLWVRDEGNVVIDPMPMSDHDRAHLESLGGADWVVMTNSDHTRSGQLLSAWTGAKLVGPAAEQDVWPYACDRWLADGDELVDGLEVITMEGSKTPGELALLIGGHTLVTGDLIRAHRGGSLMMLPDAKLTDRAAAIRSIERCAARPGIEAVLVGDGWHLFRGGASALAALVAAEAHS
jgi:glyoxylase-like metal-dependent hydrolase (beta-lactamase superfamily II)